MHSSVQNVYYRFFVKLLKFINQPEARETRIFFTCTNSSLKDKTILGSFMPLMLLWEPSRMQKFFRRMFYSFSGRRIFDASMEMFDGKSKKNHSCNYFRSYWYFYVRERATYTLDYLQSIAVILILIPILHTNR